MLVSLIPTECQHRRWHFTLFSASENNVFQVRKQCFPSQKKTFSKSENDIFLRRSTFHPLFRADDNSAAERGEGRCF